MLSVCVSLWCSTLLCVCECAHLCSVCVSVPTSALCVWVCNYFALCLCESVSNAALCVWVYGAHLYSLCACEWVPTSALWLRESAHLCSLCVSIWCSPLLCVCVSVHYLCSLCECAHLCSECVCECANGSCWWSGHVADGLIKQNQLHRYDNLIRLHQTRFSFIIPTTLDPPPSCSWDTEIILRNNRERFKGLEHKLKNKIKTDHKALSSSFKFEPFAEHILALSIANVRIWTYCIWWFKEQGWKHFGRFVFV